MKSFTFTHITFTHNREPIINEHSLNEVLQLISSKGITRHITYSPNIATNSVLPQDAIVHSQGIIPQNRVDSINASIQRSNVQGGRVNIQHSRGNNIIQGLPLF